MHSSLLSVIFDCLASVSILLVFDSCNCQYLTIAFCQFCISIWQLLFVSVCQYLTVTFCQFVSVLNSWFLSVCVRILQSLLVSLCQYLTVFLSVAFCQYVSVCVSYFLDVQHLLDSCPFFAPTLESSFALSGGLATGKMKLNHYIVSILWIMILSLFTWEKSIFI